MLDMADVTVDPPVEKTSAPETEESKSTPVFKKKRKKSKGKGKISKTIGTPVEEDGDVGVKKSSLEAVRMRQKFRSRKAGVDSEALIQARDVSALPQPSLLRCSGS
jgi:hypothetical protein